MGLLKSLLFEDEGKGKDPPKVSLKTPADQPVFSMGASPARAVSSGGADPTMVQEIESALDERSPAVYKQFAELLASLKDKVPEQTRYAAALATAPLMHLDVQAVSKAHEQRVDLLDTLERQFGQQADDALKTRIAAAEAAKAQATTEHEQVVAQLAQLQARRDAALAEVGRQGALVESSRTSSAEVRTHMAAAFAAVRARVTEERDALSHQTTGS